MWFERAMDADDELSEQKADLYHDTCNMRRHIGDIEGALVACQAFMQVAKPGSGAYTLTGYVYVDDHNYRMARDILIEGLAYETPSCWYYVLLGRAFHGLGDQDSAKEWYEKALALDSDDPIAHLFMGILLVDMGYSQEAIPHLERATCSVRPYYSNWARRVLSEIR